MAGKLSMTSCPPGSQWGRSWASKSLFTWNNCWLRFFVVLSLTYAFDDCNNRVSRLYVVCWKKSLCSASKITVLVWSSVAKLACKYSYFCGVVGTNICSKCETFYNPLSLVSKLRLLLALSPPQYTYAKLCILFKSKSLIMWCLNIF